MVEWFTVASGWLSVTEWLLAGVVLTSFLSGVVVYRLGRRHGSIRVVQKPTETLQPWVPPPIRPVEVRVDGKRIWPPTGTISTKVKKARLVAEGFRREQGVDAQVFVGGKLDEGP